MGDFKKLIAWQKGTELARAIHVAFKGRQVGAYSGLRRQILRAAAAIPENLAEGCAKRTRRELARFAETAYASAKEVESDLILAREVEIMSPAEFEPLSRLADEVARLCYGLMQGPPRSQGDRPA
jgi:four helix bundle protein